MRVNPYVEERGGGWFLAGSRVSIDSLIYAFRGGLSPEAIARECFPGLSLERVYGAITFYLANRAELDAYLETWRVAGDAERQVQLNREPEFAQRMTQARRELLAAS